MTAECFPEVAVELYRTVPPTDATLRDIVCRLVGNRFAQEGVRNKIHHVMLEHGEFAVGVTDWVFLFRDEQW